MNSTLPLFMNHPPPSNGSSDLPISPFDLARQYGSRSLDYYQYLDSREFESSDVDEGVGGSRRVDNGFLSTGNMDYNKDGLIKIENRSDSLNRSPKGEKQVSEDETGGEEEIRERTEEDEDENENEGVGVDKEVRIDDGNEGGEGEGEMDNEEPLYVNAKQYHRILKRRLARARLEELNRLSRSRKPYLHESRHRHACSRPRGKGGRFLTADEIAAQKAQAAHIANVVTEKAENDGQSSSS
ncbi:hypothetical protein TREMEDRAFT_59744 [Tremella mesenterica DSM 1558]|uniref:uncharacterized protein n=1 Tax=Tremella mesenterica (strain ATCC 24925 / CBS 8224 / DSM 1558 / NBRC 9311 / NRRL Y-6157 / RJB 2259-6 / UBC 559-6) TaxID=578456 RepID=UPI0003F49A93|nr:uncharacterized protein TREMEDRAFT_59744 [Tremella mesenterica DSM 1558]EIW73569.1 hypothetical protein TREMEDRAFT_59744 [Tremella mesenterica DSM 1558]